MLSVAVSSFWIHRIRLAGPWSVIHLLSIFTLVTVPLGVWRAHRHRVADHRRVMRLVFSGALGIAGLFTLLPGRIMHAVVSASSDPCEGDPVRHLRAAKPGLPGRFHGWFRGRDDGHMWPVSLWKNERKNRSREPVKGGFQGPDELYDSHLKLTGIPPCLTLKIRSPESRRVPRIFVPYPSSTR
jgi:hypothetical protein